MSRKDITDVMVCLAYRHAKQLREAVGEMWPEELLQLGTGEPEKVCYRAMERACQHGLIEYGVSLRSGWLTDMGKELIATDSPWQATCSCGEVLSATSASGLHLRMELHHDLHQAEAMKETADQVFKEFVQRIVSKNLAVDDDQSLIMGKRWDGPYDPVSDIRQIGQESPDFLLLLPKELREGDN